jgi:hypothetical protein
MAHTSFEDVDHEGANAAPANLDESGALGRGDEVEPSEEEVLAEINRYMGDLLDRTGQRSASRAAPVAADDESRSACKRRSGDDRRVQNDRRGAEEGQTGVAAEGTRPQGKSPDKSRRTAHAEPGPNLSAMRKLAKDSAHEAIAAHDSKLIINRARGKLCVASGAACTAAFLSWMEPSHSAGTFPITLLALTIASICGAQSLRLLLESRRVDRAKPPEEAS